MNLLAMKREKEMSGAHCRDQRNRIDKTIIKLEERWD